MSSSKTKTRKPLDKTIPAGKFKDQCLSLLDDVYKFGGQIVITKYGNVVARLVPPHNYLLNKPFFGCLEGTVQFNDDDLLAPVDVEWNALKDPEDE